MDKKTEADYVEFEADRLEQDLRLVRRYPRRYKDRDPESMAKGVQELRDKARKLRSTK